MFEHPGQSTFPVSVFVVKRGGMVVICAGTTGYNLTMDARYLWMHQKRVQGSHFANLLQASQANKLVVERRIDPCMSEVFPWDQIPKAHMRMYAQRAQAGEHGGAGLGADDGPAHLRGRARGQPAPARRLGVRSRSDRPMLRATADALQRRAATGSSPTAFMRLNSKMPRLSSAPRMTITAVIWKKIIATISCDRPA